MILNTAARVVPVLAHFFKQTYLYSQLVSEKTQRKSAMAGGLLKNSWRWRGYSKEIVLR